MNDNTLDSGFWDREYPTEDEMQNEEIDGRLYDDELYEDFVEEYEPEEQSLMDNARIRLEQGRLYEMLIKHDLFDGVDADPKAVSNVQQEIKGFIMERLEILLGMKAEKEIEVHKVESQFNDMEVQALKMVASRITKGASTQQKIELKKEPSPLSPVQKKVSKQNLNTLSNKKVLKQNKLNTTPSNNRKSIDKPNKKIKKEINKEIAKTSNKGMSVEQLAMKDIKYLETLKDMPLEKKAEIVSKRHAKPVPKSTISGASSEQQAQDQINAHYQTKSSINNSANTWMALLKKAGKV